MKYLAIGDAPRLEELISLLPDSLPVATGQEIPGNVAAYDVVFDLCFDEVPHRLLAYQQASETLLIAGAAGQSLAKALHDTPIDRAPLLIGMNTLPTFIRRGLLEWSTLSDTTKTKGEEIAAALQLPVEWIDDRTGMVTPRIILMLINEACYTLQEGTAGMEDIDQGMKLGTNYPYGPFEWADRIGIAHVHRILEALHQDTGDERYRISPLLRRQYLMNKPFYG